MSLDERLRTDLAALGVDPPAPGPTLDRVRARGQRRRRRRVIVPVAAALVAILVLVTGAIAGARRSSTLHVVGPPSTVARPAPSTTGYSTTTAPATTTSTPSTTVGVTTTVPSPTTVGTTECPTDLGIGDSAGFGSIGLTKVTPRASIAGLGPITAYRDSHRFTELLGPPGWTCHALDAADGSSELNISAPGSAPGADGNITNGIASQIVPACVGCIHTMVCGVFPASATAPVDVGIPCSSTPGAGETDITLDPSTVSFSVPTGVKGTWDNTNGSFPADGVVMLVNRESHYEAYSAVCVLPSSQHAVCTAVLDDFVARLR